jgi:phosphatidate cytidylyltransferase
VLNNSFIPGLFWFVVPVMLVICNDTMAYFCGLLVGRKIIPYPFLSLSPNKTWEGFLGGAVFTVLCCSLNAN